ncbi:DUF4159 domain-containing protein [Candidatus Chrysopegis kryptomonas]|uniref:DUF4159 domain-containing protein n=1 Tax=Candidatus Chryseopegocella kryptomonas TaxID=1633643 RepID=A0A0P1MTG3_9BACT|nr:DUF4159 domain-containing protein [Candidatus Chrysopegis kryptomonas]CUS99044.1 protein of unknown function (DUF4159) [Candidatus Chrysopegis kryptomonas]
MKIKALLKMLRKIALILILIFALTGCDNVYRFLFFPPQKVEYEIVPDLEMLKMVGDTSYYIGKDSMTIVFDKGTFKVEIKYMSDYQLNNFEFPEESKGGIYSTNPYTYGDWVDPELGYTPNRFTVFKVSIYNYTAPKINFDPENAILLSDRGDKFIAYGLEAKTSKFHSIEEYYRARKGSSGIDEDVFEARMGIARRTMLTYGRPLYKGDSREGLIVFDPLSEGVERVKVVLKNFIVGYDENNMPSDFIDINFYFKRVPVIRKVGEVEKIIASASENIDMKSLKEKEIKIFQVKYGGDGEEIVEAGIKNLIDFLNKKENLKITFESGRAESPSIAKSDLVIISGGVVKPQFSPLAVDNFVACIKNGGIILIDDLNHSRSSQFNLGARDLLERIKSRFDGSYVDKIFLTHSVYSIWAKIKELPLGADDIVETKEFEREEKYNYLEGLFWQKRLIVVFSNKGYMRILSKFDNPQIDNTSQLQLFSNILIYAVSTRQVAMKSER